MYTTECRKSLQEHELRGFATQNATVHHSIVDLSPMKVAISRHTIQTSMEARGRAYCMYTYVKWVGSYPRKSGGKAPGPP